MFVGDEVDYVVDCVGIVSCWIVVGYYFDLFDCGCWYDVGIDCVLGYVDISDVMVVE